MPKSLLVPVAVNAKEAAEQILLGAETTAVGGVPAQGACWVVPAAANDQLLVPLAPQFARI